MENALPAIVDGGAATDKCVAAAGLTVIDALVPLIDPVTVSVAVIVRGPAVRSVTENVLLPLMSVESPGSVGLPSVDVKCTIPA